MKLSPRKVNEGSGQEPPPLTGAALLPCVGNLCRLNFMTLCKLLVILDKFSI